MIVNTLRRAVKMRINASILLVVHIKKLICATGDQRTPPSKQEILCVKFFEMREKMNQNKKEVCALNVHRKQNTDK